MENCNQRSQLSWVKSFFGVIIAACCILSPLPDTKWYIAIFEFLKDVALLQDWIISLEKSIKKSEWLKKNPPWPVAYDEKRISLMSSLISSGMIRKCNCLSSEKNKFRIIKFQKQNYEDQSIFNEILLSTLIYENDFSLDLLKSLNRKNWINDLLCIWQIIGMDVQLIIRVAMGMDVLGIEGYSWLISLPIIFKLLYTKRIGNHIHVIEWYISDPELEYLTPIDVGHYIFVDIAAGFIIGLAIISGWWPVINTRLGLIESAISTVWLILLYIGILSRRISKNMKIMRIIQLITSLMIIIITILRVSTEWNITTIGCSIPIILPLL